MNIVYITKNAQFPYGNAGTNRLLSYIPGLVAAGHSVTVLCMWLLDKQNQELLDSKASCFFQGIKIKYVSGKTLWPKSGSRLILKAYLLFKAHISIILYLIKNRVKIDIVQLYVADIKFYHFCSWWCHLLKLKIVLERSELPDIIKKRDYYIKTKKGIKYIRKSEKSFGLFDAWILETQTLLDYYGKFFSYNTKCLLVPMTVEVERFTNIKEKRNNMFGYYIAYCGNMSEYDGVSILIRAYSLVRVNHPNIKLVLAGDSDNVPNLKFLAESLGVKDDVLFIGKISRDEVPSFLSNATILALASPTSDRACATMPCKVGEYLCTANPVVVTGLGEINKYLKDGESAFLSQPDSPEAFAAKIEEVFDDMSKAKEVGLNGKQVAIDNFSSEAQVKRIEDFYKELIKT